MLEFWFSGFVGLLQPDVIAFLILGMGIGLFVGVLPGLGGTTALALLTPVTYGLEPVSALALAGGGNMARQEGAEIEGLSSLEKALLKTGLLDAEDLLS